MYPLKSLVQVRGKDHLLEKKEITALSPCAQHVEVNSFRALITNQALFRMLSDTN